MKKYFFISDIHSFFTEMIDALHKNGFDENNHDHILVVLGDVFDRGFETKKVFLFLHSLPKERLILIRGNHESLYRDLMLKSFPDSYDFSNGTVRTFCDIAGFNEEVLSGSYWWKKAYLEDKEPWEYTHMIQEYWNQIVDIVSMSDVTKWIESDDWVNYFETDKYIFVHSWIPAATRPAISNYDYPQKEYDYKEEYGYREDWRYATDSEWQDASWGCPWKKAKEDWNKTGKTIVCGHWHTSDFFNHLTKRHKNKYDCPLFKSKRYKLIGLDACTAVSGKVNVLVLNEDEL